MFYKVKEKGNQLLLVRLNNQQSAEIIYLCNSQCAACIFMCTHTRRYVNADRCAYITSASQEINNLKCEKGAQVHGLLSVDV